MGGEEPFWWAAADASETRVSQFLLGVGAVAQAAGLCSQQSPF